MPKRILVVLTSHNQLGDTGEKTGLWLEELAAPYYAFQEAGAVMTLTSPKGGYPPLDPRSTADDFQTDATRRFAGDSAAQEALAYTTQLSAVASDEYDALFYPGGHGPLWDLANDEDSIRLIEQFWSQSKPVAAVCHAPSVLLKAKDHEGESLVGGKQVTGFSNAEEKAVGLDGVVPFLLEDALKEQGGQYNKGDDWSPFTCQDGLLITGQNPASSAATANLLLAALA